MEILKMTVETKNASGKYVVNNFYEWDDKSYWMECFARDTYGCLKKYKGYRFKRSTNYDGTAYVTISYGNECRTIYLVKE